MLKLIITLFVFSTIIYSQNQPVNGQLLRIDLRENSIDISDTLGYWSHYSDEYTYSDSRFYQAISTNDKQYLLKSYSYSNELLWQYYRLESIFDTESMMYKDFSLRSGFDVIDPFDAEPHASPIESGWWLFGEELDKGFLSNTDSLTLMEDISQNSLIHICGKVDSAYLCVFYNPYDNGNSPYKYYLSDLSNSPMVDTISSVKISLDEWERPLYIQELIQDHYLWTPSRGGLYLYQFKQNKFQFVKTMIDTFYHQNWIYKDNSVFAKGYKTIYRYDFNVEDTSFNSRTTLINGSYNVDNFYNYAAVIPGSDTLQIYSFNTKSVIKEYDISNLNSPKLPLIEYPYVYLHIKKNISIIEDQKEQVILPNSFNIRTYPNPFNSSVSIEFMNFKKQKIDIGIYQVNGAKVADLNSDIFQHGINKIIWTPENLASGLYIVVIRSDSNIGKTKLIYLK